MNTRSNQNTWPRSTATALSLSMALGMSAVAAGSADPMLEVQLTINAVPESFSVEGVETSPGVVVYSFAWANEMATGQVQVVAQLVDSPRLVVALQSSSSSFLNDAAIELVLTQAIEGAGDAGARVAPRRSAGACASFVPGQVASDPIQSLGDAPLVEWSFDGAALADAFPGPFALPPTSTGSQVLTPESVLEPDALVSMPTRDISTTIRFVAGSGAAVLVNTTLVADPNVADINGDGLVNSEDLGLLLAAWGRGGVADLDGSGSVDGTDLGLLLGAWNV